MTQTLAVLITCFNRKGHTLKCLTALYDSLEEYESITLDVYLVDDGSTDGTRMEVNYKFPQVKVIAGDGKLFWGGGMNKAWKEAAIGGYDFYLWLNDDTYLKPNALRELLADSTSLNYESVIVGVCEWQNSNTVSYSGYLLKNKVALQAVGRPLLCDYFNGNVVLIPKSVFSKVGFLDPVFPHNLGDIDYGMRARSLGINSYISSSSIGKCDGHRSLSAWCDPAKPLKDRIKHFNSPLTKGPKQVFIFEKRHTTLVMAVFRSSIIYIRLLFPVLWVLMGKQKLGEG